MLLKICYTTSSLFAFKVLTVIGWSAGYDTCYRSLLGLSN